MTPTLEPHFFPTPADLRAWLVAHHATERELLVGFYKKGTGRPSITWPESVDEALCFGWIDGVRRRIDDDSYSIRFTPRTATSTWSAVNIARVEALTGEGRMTPAGLAAFARRRVDRIGVYSFERADAPKLTDEEQTRFEADAAAWAWFAARPPSYRKAASHWVISAKQPATRARRLATLIADSAAGRTIAPLTRRPNPPAPFPSGKGEPTA